MRLSGGPRPYPLQLLAYGVAVVAAAFLLAWACEAAQVDIARGVVVAAVAFVAILPEYIVEVHFAFIGQAEYVTANLTGASRLLLGVCVALPAAVALLPRRWRPRAVGAGRGRAGPARRAGDPRASPALWALRGVVRGRLTPARRGRADRAVRASTCAAPRRVRRGGPEPIGVAAELAGAARAAAPPLGRRADGLRRCR